MAQIISVCSYRSDAGRSIVATNLATLLAIDGFRVGLVDMDQSPSIHFLFDIDESEIEHSLNDYLWGKCKIKDTAHDVTGKLGPDIKGKIFLISSSVKIDESIRMQREGYDVGLLTDGFRNLVSSILLDILILKTGPGLGEDAILTMAISNILISIMRPDARDYRGTASIISTARSLEVPPILVLNKIPQALYSDDARNRTEQAYGCEVAAMLPLSEEVVTLGSTGIFSLLYPNHDITSELQKLKDKILKLSPPNISIGSNNEQNQKSFFRKNDEKPISKKLASFDLEIAKILPENINDILDYAPLGISCAALAFDDKSDVLFSQRYPQLSKQDCQKLVKDLINYVASGYTLVTWNGCSFDFRVLAQESAIYEECGQLALNHVDLMLIVTFTKGWYLGLDKALRGAGVSGKVKKLKLSNGEILEDINGAHVPKLWKKREFSAVLTYLEGDVSKTLELVKTVQDSHVINWVSGSGNFQSVSVPRLMTVKECFDIPLPDTSWMSNPPQRKTFVEWIPNWEQKI